MQLSVSNFDREHPQNSPGSYLWPYAGRWGCSRTDSDCLSCGVAPLIRSLQTALRSFSRLYSPSPDTDTGALHRRGDQFCEHKTQDLVVVHWHALSTRGRAWLVLLIPNGAPHSPSSVREKALTDGIWFLGIPDRGSDEGALGNWAHLPRSP
ncbi:hypothetical protein SKAU_G00147090 [Synaphobranchus kaupii]|uniref:Uncharacterized protein n=1 Tax=Synaphobranchus kaupii TaxID=118154 RepID=A0A9Q1FTN7_SYNKA|nr:hypothetical protein SKAU_G00147090 [Synaphobranchus kaupii]